LPNSIVADFGNRHAARARDDFGHRQSAQAPLARAHAAAREKLELIWTQAAKRHCLPDRARRHLLAAACQSVIGGNSETLRRTIHAVKPWPDRKIRPQVRPELARTRIALRAAGQGLPELDRLAGVVAEEAGWDDARRAEERAAYAAAVRRHYQIADPRSARRAA
jgi:glycerol-3-phosphate dehydrogenase